MGELAAVFIVTECVELKAAVSCKRLSATGPGYQKLMVGVRTLHSSVLLGEYLPHPGVNEVTKLVGKVELSYCAHTGQL